MITRSRKITFVRRRARPVRRADNIITNLITLSPYRPLRPVTWIALLLRRGLTVKKKSIV
jgi:hypothetical protein